MGGEDEQANDGNGQADLSRRAARRHLLEDAPHGTMMCDGVGQRSDGVGDSRQRVGSGYELGLKHGVCLVEESPVNPDENLAAAHGVVGRDECIVVACKQKHVVVCQEDMGSLDFERHREVDKREVADFYLVLQIEGASGWHVGISIVSGEITHGDAGMQNGRLVEYGLGIA